MLREYCLVIGASHAEGEASSSIAPWRLSVSVQHHLIALSQLTSSDHASVHSQLSRPAFFLFFPPSVHLFPIYLFTFPISYPMWRTSISHSCISFIYLFYFHSSQPYLRIPWLILLDFLPFSLLLVMLHCSCGNFGIMPVVLWPWPGGQFLGAEGCWSSCLREPAVLDNVLDWKDEQLEGWRPVGASRGHRGHSHSKLWLPAQRYGVKEDHASAGEKELLFLCASQRTRLCSRQSRLSLTTTSAF